MDGKGWRLSFSVMVMILMVALAIKWMERPVEQVQEQMIVEQTGVNLSMYYPPLRGMKYYFDGKGMEYASFTRQVTYVNSDSLQIEDLSGTNLAQVFNISPDELKIVWSEEEFYSQDNLLEQESLSDRPKGVARDLTLLKNPLVAGNTWNDESFHREIMSTDETVILPLGTFYEVVVVKSTSLAENETVMYEYYAKNIGLIKRVSLYTQGEETQAVVSNLVGVACNPPHL